jgi:RNA polymerase sporulation-specific sigma factor
MREIILIARQDNEEMAKFVKKFEPLVKKCIRIYIKDMGYFDDAMQQGCLTIIQCVKRFDLDSETSFLGYVKRAVIYSIRDYAKKIKSDLSLDEETEEGGTLLDTLRSSDDIEKDYFNNIYNEALKEAISSLTLDQRRVIEDYYFKNLSMRDICKNKRCHYMSIVKLKERALTKLKNEIKEC